MRFVVLPSDSAPGQFFWHMQDSNNRVVGYSAETYGSEDDANRALANVLYDLKDRSKFRVESRGESFTPAQFVRLHHRAR
jgi:uncharacterized protein YegP (UPF0339 family)